MKKCYLEILQDCSVKTIGIQVTDDREYEEEEDFLFMLQAESAEKADASLYEKVALGFDRLIIRIPQNDGLFLLFFSAI